MYLFSSENSEILAQGRFRQDQRIDVRAKSQQEGLPCRWKTS